MQESTNPNSTAQHGPDAASSDSWSNQTPRDHKGWDKEGMQEDEFIAMHNVNSYDAAELYKSNIKNAMDAVQQTPPRQGDQRGGDNTFVNPINAEIVDGIKVALDQMKTNQ